MLTDTDTDVGTVSNFAQVVPVMRPKYTAELTIPQAHNKHESYDYRLRGERTGGEF